MESLNQTITNRLLAFCHLARAEGFNVGIEETRAALEAAGQGMLMPKSLFRRTLRALMCSNHDEFGRFDALFERFWKRRSSYGDNSIQRKISQPDAAQNHQHSLVMSGEERRQTAEEQGKKVTGASAMERLQKTDFSQLSHSEIEKLDELAQHLWRLMSRRLTRRMKNRQRKEQISLRQTIRQNIALGGEPIKLRFRSRHTIKPRLVILLDVSGSMDQYSFFFLKFIHALQKHFERVESFIFSTRLLHVTAALKDRGLTSTLKTLAQQAEAWSSGTRIGECFQAFNHRHAKRTLSRNSIVVVLSDGLDTGDPEMFRQELSQIKRRTRKVVWLNPLLGMDHYEPITRGLSAALPLIDVFVSAHNLQSLMELEKHLVR